MILRAVLDSGSKVVFWVIVLSFDNMGCCCVKA